LMAKKYGEGEYLDAAVKLHRWREKYMSMPDGSWRNDFANGWRGITVFGAVSLAEALKYCGDILDKKDRDAMRARLLSATKFIDKFLTVHRSNVNYPITASLAMHLAGEVFGDKKMLERGRVFASNAIRYITDRDKLVFGEAQPNDLKTAKKCFAVDLGYNVEESLPALVQYAVEAGDSEVLEAACESYLKHIEFMLPDGAWDNSWGTRNAKWTYWGSRTSDGCQAALALVADKNPVFYRAALKNAELLERCTADNLLYGGVHYREFGIKPCIHHAFAHAKVMANVVQNARPAPSGASAARLPRESAYGLKVFQDIDTALIASGSWRATATGYDAVYHYGKSGHPTGGALSVLWHEKAGAVFAAGMNEYELVEKSNMQPNEGFDTMATVPRIEISQGGALFMNAADLKAEMSAGQDGAGFFARARSRLVDAKQKPAAGGSKCETEYLFGGESATLSFSCENPSARIVLPLVAAPSERAERPARLGEVLLRDLHARQGHLHADVLVALQLNGLL
ncbi:MAG: hypothetical protein IJI37_07495, partial [Opitutales bacterium]|nr:hypothetical protein [Opitutales bacterium]